MIQHQGDKKKLLIFIDWYLPAFKAGGPIRSCYNLVNLLKFSYDIYIFTSNKDIGSSKSIIDVHKVNKWIELEPNVKIYYSRDSSFFNIQKIVNTIHPDIVYLNSMWSINFSIKPLILFYNSAKYKIILAPRGMLHTGALQYSRFKKMFFLKIANIFRIYKNIYFHATDDQEYRDIHSNIFTESKNYNVSNIIIISDIPPNNIPIKAIHKKPGYLNLVFVSRISQKKNLDYFLELTKKVRPQYSICIDIYGPNEDRSYSEKCEKVAAQLPSNIVIKFLGELKFDEVNEKLADNHFFILPTHGENFGYAIFESFAAGRPVIISDQTPWRDLEIQKAGFDLPLSEPEKFIEAIEAAAKMDQSEYDIWCTGAHHYAEKFINESNLEGKYLTLFN
jgi:glycosyltransferase involved in cell wall biosynthesis